ncbi:MAG TPA: GspH/FimT family pseudopilin [Micromonosporaceae bacterium]|jgi:type IV fimbrial biogenesis protein FimT
MRRGFTLIEMLVALVIVSLVLLIGLPKFTSAINQQNLRGSRTTVINMLAKARTASLTSNRLTWLKVSTGGKAWIIARPRLVAAAGSDADTLGLVEDLNKRYGITISTTNADSVGFDPRGIASLAASSVVFTVNKSGHSESITVDKLGRVVK